MLKMQEIGTKLQNCERLLRTSAVPAAPNYIRLTHLKVFCALGVDNVWLLFQKSDPFPFPGILHTAIL